MITTENRAGRLVEVRLASPVSLDEIGRLGRELKRAMLTHRKIAVAADLSKCTVFPPEIYEAFVSLLRSDNPGIERSAYLLADSAVFTLQLERMVKDAANPVRRTFRDRAALRAWLGQVLTSVEQGAVDQFLAA
jgi:hypothetical protein